MDPDKIINDVNRNVLILGGGARERVIAEKINSNHTIITEITDFTQIIDMCKKEKINLVIPSSETYLCQGITDYIIKEYGENMVFGPNKYSAQIEGSKHFSKEIMTQLNIPTAPYHSYKNDYQIEDILMYINDINWDYTEINIPPVIKYSGLAKGKGVYLPNSKEEAISNINELYNSNKSNWEGIIIEDRLVGTEVSIMAFCNGTSANLMPQSQDHKRIYDNDKGPNTGGMGSICPVNVLTECELKIVKIHMDNVVKKLNYIGVLYAGLIKTNEDIYFLEFNCRMGDPETQVVLNLLETPLTEIISNCIHGVESNIKWSNKSAACVVLSHELYPKEKLSESVDINIGVLEKCIKIYDSNVKGNGESLRTNGGRVMSVVSVDSNIEKALINVYNNIHKIQFQGAYYRRDIGRKSIKKLTYPKNDVKVGVLATGNATCISTLLKETNKKHIKVIITNNHNSTIFQKGSEYRIPCVYIDDSDKSSKKKYYERIANILRLFDIDIVLLAGFMRIVPSIIYDEFPTFNIHPSLLPRHKGLMDIAVHYAAIESRDKFTGCTLHRVTGKVDSGRIISQYQIPITTRDPGVLKSNVQDIEKECVFDFITRYGQDCIEYDVNINEGNAFVDDLRDSGNVSIDGGFCAIVEDDSRTFGFSADGCGTKLDLANEHGYLNTIGIDLVAMNVNDLLAGGCVPKYFMDYIAVDKMDRGKCNKIITGIVEGCNQIGCKLIGGETAELTGTYLKNKLDLAGFAMGEKIIDLPKKHLMKKGCFLYGLLSSGIHSNGYTLVRKLLKSPKFEPPSMDLIMTPTSIYFEMEQIYNQHKDHILGVAHITGGGFPDNISRIIPEHLDFVLENWEFPGVFKWIQKETSLSRIEMMRIFNCGYGMVIITDTKLNDVGDLIGELVEKY